MNRSNLTETLDNTQHWPIPILTILTPPLIPDTIHTIKQIMERHGGSMKQIDADTNSFTFPEGTLKAEMWSPTMTLRYKISFPDGYRIFEINNPKTHKSNLRFPLADFPENLRRKYMHLLKQQDKTLQ